MKVVEGGGMRLSVEHEKRANERNESEHALLEICPTFGSGLPAGSGEVRWKNQKKKKKKRSVQ